MKLTKSVAVGACALIALLALGIWQLRKAPTPPPQTVARPVLTITTVLPARVEWEQLISATGNVFAKQEVVVAAETGGATLLTLEVDVGQWVVQGQELARMDDRMTKADLRKAQARVQHAKAGLAASQSSADRARSVAASGALSQQQVQQYVTEEQVATASLALALAELETESLRLRQTRIRAPASGRVTHRAGVLGSVVQPGAELYRLIRGGELVWHAELGDDDLARVYPGLRVSVTQPDGAITNGSVRQVSPVLDPVSRRGVVYVDLAEAKLKPGMFVKGEIKLPASTALVLPQSAVVLRDGHAYVFEAMPEGIARQLKVILGRRQGDQVEVLQGLTATTRVALAGAGFLRNGDTIGVAP